MTNSVRAALLKHPDLNGEMRLRMERCGTPGGWGIGYCRLAACDRCWRQRLADWTLEAFEVLADSSPADLRWIEIALDSVEEIDALALELRRVRKLMRNLVARLRTKDQRSARIRAIGAFDVGWDSGQKVWSLKLRFLIDFSASNQWMATTMLCRSFPGYGRVKVTPIGSQGGLEPAIEAAMAKLLVRSLDGNAQVAVLQALYETAFAAGGFRLFRFHLRPTAEVALGGKKQIADVCPTWFSSGWDSDFNPFRTNPP